MSDGSRTWTTLLAATAIALAAVPAGASAQGVYRIVGPDGRVTYADQPPPTIAPKGRIDVLRAGRGPALVPPTPSPSSDTAATGADGAGGPVQSASRRSSAAPQRQAVVATPVAAVAAGAASSTAAPAAKASVEPAAKAAVEPAVEAAVIGVLGIEDVVRRTESICVSTQPTSARRYSAVVDDWARRNTRTVVIARRVLAREFDVPTRESIEAGVRARNAAQFEEIQDTPDAARIAWCDRSVAEIATGRMDVHDKPRLAGPLEARPAR